MKEANISQSEVELAISNVLVKYAQYTHHLYIHTPDTSQQL